MDLTGAEVASGVDRFLGAFSVNANPVTPRAVMLSTTEISGVKTPMILISSVVSKPSMKSAFSVGTIVSLAVPKVTEVLVDLMVNPNHLADPKGVPTEVAKE